jgi:hypothetical protein
MVIIRDRDGSRAYSLRELAAILDRFRKYSFDKMIFVVANDHDQHFSRIKKILELLDMSELARRLEPVNFNRSLHTQIMIRNLVILSERQKSLCVNPCSKIPTKLQSWATRTSLMLRLESLLCGPKFFLTGGQLTVLWKWPKGHPLSAAQGLSSNTGMQN